MGHWFFMTLAIVFANCKSSELIPPTDQCPENCTCLPVQQHILCANASLTSIPSKVANNTVELHLQRNSFSVLETSFLRDLPDLRGLYLSECRISSIESGAFQEVDSIRHLHLDSNQLKELKNGTFKNLSNLLYLHLENNKISYLIPGIFLPLKKLSVLYLNHNLLSDLPDGSLSGLAQLRWLDLGFNILSDIAYSSFYSMNNLRRLNLEMNNITSVPSSVRLRSGLQMLRLSGNYIKRLSTLSFGRNLRTLTELYLDMVGLERVSSLTFRRLSMLEVLDLRNNSLEYLPVSRIKIFTKIYLTGNPWKCDCSLIGLHTRLQLTKVMDKDQQAECQSPKALQGQSLINVNLGKLTCPAFGEDNLTTTATPGTIEQSALPQPSKHPVTTTSKSTAVVYKTPPPRPVFSSTPRNNIAEVWDPCLADHISNVLVRPTGEETLEVSWSVSGDFSQFEIYYNAGQEKSSLHIIGGLTNIQINHLHPGTTYTVCIVPQNVDINKCRNPKYRQCAEGRTEGIFQQPHAVYSPPVSTSPFLILGVSITIVVLVAISIFTVYIMKSRNINFQRYYNEEEDEGSRRQELDPYKWDGVYENIDDDRHVYVTASSLWGMDNDKLDCSLAEPVSLPSVPKYVTL
ncbi:uncharacterized protein WCC33_009001 [Rhinophrynus dorsalis]